MGAVQDGAGAAAASSQGIGGIGGDDEDGLVVVVPKTSAQLRPGAGEVGAPGSVAPWPPASKESRRVGCAIDATAFLVQPLAADACGTKVRSAKGLPWLK